MISVTRQKRSLQAFLPSHQKAIGMICRLFLGALVLALWLTAAPLAQATAPHTLRLDDDPVMEDGAVAFVPEDGFVTEREWPVWELGWWWVWRR